MTIHSSFSFLPIGVGCELRSSFPSTWGMRPRFAELLCLWMPRGSLVGEMFFGCDLLGDSLEYGVSSTATVRANAA